MNFFTRFLLVGLLLSMIATARGALDTRATSGGRIAVSVGGVELPFVKAFEGGELFARSVNDVGGPGGLPKKHAVVVGNAPITLVIGGDLTPELVSWINDLCVGGAAQRAVVVARMDFNSVPTAVTSYPAATLTEVRFPKLDGSSKEAAYVTLVIAPGSSTPGTWTLGSKAAAKRKEALSSNYRLQSGNLPGGRVASIEGLTIKRSLQGNAPEFSNLILEVSAADEAPWKAWRDSFLAQGQSSDADEKSFTLELLPPNLAPPALLTLQFSHVGMLRVSSNKFEANTEKVSRFTVELYYEGVTLAGAAAAPK